MRTGVTLIDITRAADQLLAEGERPTVDGVRKVLGTGSPATVNNLLKEYYQALPTRLNLPAAIATAAAELYQKIRETAQGEVAEQQENFQRDLAADREKLSADRSAFESDKASLQQQLAALTSDKQGLQEQLSALQAKVVGLERSLSEQTERAAAAQSRALSATEERERATAKHAAEVAHLREQAEGNERHLLARIEDQKTQTKRIATEREKEAAAAQSRISALETSVSESSKLLAATRGELATAQRDLTRERELRTEVEAALSHAQERFTKEQQAWTAERERLKNEVMLEQSAIKHLRQERDDAMREAARQEGKAMALLGQLDEVRGELIAQRNSQDRVAKAP
ncbi:DNA-binding protein [Stagnimonas aquatica]|uniref:DNA-binding protein n=1 Tax=Stagnimonas aquatica TaxID=2689987 RepID=A0A3N0UZ69_9GAMM|nr:DNA-binding protein [Stagnimonas aquatica]ROH85652.1 DNA-binding protein [Stagnimonas aquatica]